ncbi:hypothetical protein HAX54_010675 [Datura stramonium]|uniref:Uncharacterized protein n=1 Tax=Datura stramonium TaxID=4076 RepID=A0ABS8TI32_DATST|nr:hypothetical protein [Datura stramonium]
MIWEKGRKTVCRSSKPPRDLKVILVIDTAEEGVEKTKFVPRNSVLVSKIKLNMFSCIQRSSWSDPFRVVKILLQREIKLGTQNGQAPHEVVLRTGRTAQAARQCRGKMPHRALRHKMFYSKEACDACSWERVCLAYALMTGMPINVGDYPLSEHSRALYKVGLAFSEPLDDDDPKNNEQARSYSDLESDDGEGEDLGMGDVDYAPTNNEE